MSQLISRSVGRSVSKLLFSSISQL